MMKFRLIQVSCLLLLVLIGVSEAVDCDSKCREFNIFLYSSTKNGVYCVEFQHVDCGYCEWSSSYLCHDTLPLHPDGCADHKTLKCWARYPTTCSNICALGTAPAASSATIVKDSTDVFAKQTYNVAVCPLVPDDG